MWRDEGDIGQAPWKARADEVAQEHAKNHPDYSYQPRKPSEKKRRNRKSKTQASTPAAQMTLPSPALNTTAVQSPPQMVSPPIAAHIAAPIAAPVVAPFVAPVVAPIAPPATGVQLFNLLSEDVWAEFKRQQQLAAELTDYDIFQMYQAYNPYELS
jgi:hypothetical protein